MRPSLASWAPTNESGKRGDSGGQRVSLLPPGPFSVLKLQFAPSTGSDYTVRKQWLDVEMVTPTSCPSSFTHLPVHSANTR